MGRDLWVHEQTPGVSWERTAIYLCPSEGLHSAVLHAGRALPNVQGVEEEGAILRCELQRPVPNGREL